MGDPSFFGPGMTVDTSSVFTVVTQFITSVSTVVRNFAVIIANV
jgi:cellulose 1,4-beta-cellobiosidase